jgi:hypothetical protein
MSWHDAMYSPGPWHGCEVSQLGNGGKMPMPLSIPHTWPGLPQAPARPPPPQVEGALHVPHWSTPPHPSEAGPQEIPCCTHEIGLQLIPGTHCPDTQMDPAVQLASDVQATGQHVAV